MTEPKKSSASRDWIYALLWTLLIYATVPYARPLLRWLGTNFGGDRTIGILFAGLVFLALFLFGVRIVKRPGFDVKRGVWFGVVVAAYGYFMFTIEIPPEKIHFLEYGILGLLVFRAIGHRTRNFLAYPETLAVCFMAGLLDEYLQSLVPKRVGEMADAVWNLISVALALVGLAKTWVPDMPMAESSTSLSRSALGRPWPAAVRTRRDICQTAALLSIALSSAGFFMQNFSDFGHSLTDPDIGKFNSAFSREDLARADASRGEEIAAVLDATDDADYDTFLKRYSAKSDPYIHEARVHLFRRDRYLKKSASTDSAVTEGEKIGHRHVALMENRILEKYFPTLMAHTRHHRWTGQAADLERDLATHHALLPNYESAVAKRMITSYDIPKMWGAIGILIAFFWLAAGLGSRSVRPDPG